MPFKQRPPRNAKERQLQADWEEALARHAKPLERGAVAKSITVDVTLALRTRGVLPTMTPGTREGSDLYRLPSFSTKGDAVAAKKESPKYSGDAMLGVSVLHKSNGIPVFRKEDILDIAKMRR